MLGGKVINITMNAYYETHVYPDSSFPFIYHLHEIDAQHRFLLHWHENIELIFVTSGSLQVMLNNQKYTVHQDELIVINSSCIHFCKTVTPVCTYACLIPDLNFCKSFGLPVDELHIQPVVTAPIIRNLFQQIMTEFHLQLPFQKQMLKANIMALMTELCRHHAGPANNDNSAPNKNHIEIIQAALLYMKQHANEAISTDDIAKYLKFSKHYFCRLFKEITTYSPVYYLNLLRCCNARRMLIDGQTSVHDIAILCGFENISYFTRTYKKYMGILPSEEKKCSASEETRSLQAQIYSRTDVYPKISKIPIVE